MKLIGKKRISKAVVIFNILAVIMFLISVFTIYKSNSYISGLIEQGFDANSEWIEVFNYYITTVTPYLFYGTVLGGLAYVIQRITYLIDIQNEMRINKEYLKEEQSIIENNEKDDIESIFNELED